MIAPSSCPTHSAPRASGPSATDMVEEVLERWPRTLAVFVRHRMACPGCPMARFQTVAEVADDYGLDPAALLEDFARAIAGDH